VSYQVLARKWRPQQFDEVVGQKGVTQTLRNALGSGRIAQAFVFAGARGVGKTTTARILARALNCERGATADPCGVCDMCVEIAEGRDLDVLEIDAATHTGVDNVRDVIIDGLAIRPVRDRYKIFIIDEVHQLSNSSFNALLKSMEEPPPHVVFMMATTELHKIPDTILSRAQVYEFRTIGTRPIAEQLRKIADAEGVTVDDAALALVARAAEGSMRDAQSAFDQVLAFGGTHIDVAQVSMVLGLIGRDLLLDIVDTVAREDAASVFDVAARIVESGQDLKHVCRELARLVRDLMILQIDSARTNDPEYAVDGDRERLNGLAAAFSREDLLRAFDLIAKLEADLRFATQPRYHLEMAMLRWIHLRRLVPIADLISAVEKNAPLPSLSRPSPGAAPRPMAAPPRPSASLPPAPPAASPRPAASGSASLVSKLESRANTSAPASANPGANPGAGLGARMNAAESTIRSAPAATASLAPASPAAVVAPPAASPDASASAAGAPVAGAPAAQGMLTGDPTDAAIATFRDALLAEIKRVKPKFIVNTLIASAHRIDVSGRTIAFVFGPRPSTLAGQFEQQRASLEEIATKLAGKPMKISAVEDKALAGVGAPAAASPAPAASSAEQDRLKQSVMSEPAVQALLDVFPAEIKDIEEM
jgi:DNA polymerase-3 subunit gamma/tau